MANLRIIVPDYTNLCLSDSNGPCISHHAYHRLILPGTDLLDKLEGKLKFCAIVNFMSFVSVVVFFFS